MRLLFICPGYGRINRGVEVFLHELVQRLDMSRFEVCILGQVEAQRDGVRCIKIPTLSRSLLESWDRRLPFRILSLLHLGNSVELESFLLSLCATRHLATGSYDLIFPFGGYWTYFLAFLFKKRAKLVSIGHAGPVKRELKLSDAFVAITDIASCQAKEMNCPDTIVLIPNGVDTARFHPGTDRGGMPKTVLCVAAFSSHKRYDLLFDAMMLLDPSVRLVCAGRGAVPAALSGHPLCQSGRVEFRSVPHDEMPDIYRQADVFTLPSPEEAFGLVFLEALATGLNVVAADAPRQRYVIGPSGFFCDVHDPAAYARSLDEALSHPQGSANIRRAAQFGWERVAGLYQEFFHALR
jgi:glycosyltransferase involved in cell wall biosynthesis